MFKHTKPQFFLILFSCFLFQNGYASNGPYDVSNVIHHPWFFGIGGGAAKMHLAGRDTVLNGAGVQAPFNQDSYAMKSPSTMQLLQLLIGYQWKQQTFYMPIYSLALEYNHYFNSNIHGTVQQYSLPEFTNYNYKLNYEADNFFLNGKIDLFQYRMILPYVSLGVGFFFNHLNDYQETPIGAVTPRISPNYQGQTTTNSALKFGLGLDVIVSNDCWLTFGYTHIIQFGSLHTNNGVSSWSDTNLSLRDITNDYFFVTLQFALQPELLRG